MHLNAVEVGTPAAMQRLVTEVSRPRACSRNKSSKIFHTGSANVRAGKV
jgi:hypothetical protein